MRLNVDFRDPVLFRCLPITRRITGRSLEERSFVLTAVSSRTQRWFMWEIFIAANRST